MVRRLTSSGEGIVGLVICVPLIVIAAVGPWLAPQDPNSVNLADRLLPPSSSHWFGTDDLGRDLLSRVLEGGHRTVISALFVVTVSAAIGLVVGVVAGFMGGVVDQLLMRVTDVFVGYPALLLAVAIAASLGVGLIQTAIALSVVWWAGYARIIRGQASAIRNLPYVESAKTAGASSLQIMRRHVVPNVSSVLVVKFTLDVALVVESVAALGFIGLGAQAPDAEWGAIIANSRRFAVEAWWFPVMPGIALLLVVVGFNLLGDGISHAIGGGTTSRKQDRRFRRLVNTTLKKTLEDEA